LIRFFNTSFPSRIVFLGVSEVALVVVAFLAAMLVRLGANDTSIVLSYEQGFLRIGIITAAFIICMYYFDLYDSSVLGNRREVLARLIQVLGSASALLAFVYYEFPHLSMGRGILAIGLILVALLLFLWRRLFLAINSMAQFAERALIFGDGPLALPLMKELETRPELGVRVVGQVLTGDNGNGFDPNQREMPTTQLSLLSAETELQSAVDQNKVNRIIIAMGDRRGKLPVEALLSLKSHGVQIQDGAETYEAITGKVPIEFLRLGWLLFSPGFHVSQFLLLYKRLASILLSIVGLIIGLPLFPLIALGIKLTSKGRVFYSQERVGCDGAIFHCYKFRTMRADAEADTGPTWASDDDPRITPIGHFLRTLRLDEIPQLWNVLRGDMSLVGPRPERPEFVEKLKKEIPYYYLRESVRPGITGWAQIRYRYGNSVEDAKEKLRYDLFYIKNISPGLDFLIFFQTIKIILLGRGAK
jgi:sugar transferase (PEP-CTERM system associated)